MVNLNPTMESRICLIYLLQQRLTVTKTPVVTDTVQAGLGPSYAVHCVYSMGDFFKKNVYKPIDKLMKYKEQNFSSLS